MNEFEWQNMQHDLQFSVGTTVFPDGTPDMDSWHKRFDDRFDGWSKAMNVSVAYSRFDSVKEYLKRKLFKVKAQVELEGGKVNEIWS